LKLKQHLIPTSQLNQYFSPYLSFPVLLRWVYLFFFTGWKGLLLEMMFIGWVPEKP